MMILFEKAVCFRWFNVVVRILAYVLLYGRCYISRKRENLLILFENSLVLLDL